MKALNLRPASALVLSAFCLAPFVTRAADDRSSSSVKQQQSKSNSGSSTTGNQPVRSHATGGSTGNANHGVANKAVSQKYIELWNAPEINPSAFARSASELFDPSFVLKSDFLRVIAGEQLSTEADAAAAPAAAPSADSDAGAPAVNPADNGQPQPSAGNVTGDAAILMKAMEQLRTAVPDLKVKLDEAMASADMVVAHWSANGTQKGILLGINPTSKMYMVTGVDIHHFKNGKLIHITSIADTTRLIAQLRSALGIPATPSTGTAPVPAAGSPASPSAPTSPAVPAAGASPTDPMTP